MPYDPAQHSGGLRRLSEANYAGRTFIHWSMTLQNRATGWLNPLHHAVVREHLCHALSRFELLCAAYCLMPDHGHFLWVGVSALSDQKHGAAHFRQAWNDALRLSGCALQKQAFDHVLRDDERKHGAFGAIAHYILENPTRGGLCARWHDWPYSGALVPGYPDLDPRSSDYWERFWRIYERRVNKTASRESLAASATEDAPRA